MTRGEALIVSQVWVGISMLSESVQTTGIAIMLAVFWLLLALWRPRV